MKILILAIGIALILGLGAVWLRAAPKTPQIAIQSPQATQKTVTDAIQKSVPFHVYFPTVLPADYAITTTVNTHIEGRVFYRIEASSGVPLIMVNQASVGSQAAQRLYTADQMRAGGTVTTTEISGQAGYLGIETGGLTPMTVVLFIRDGVEIQLSTLNAVDPRLLIQFANEME